MILFAMEVLSLLHIFMLFMPFLTTVIKTSGGSDCKLLSIIKGISQSLPIAFDIYCMFWYVTLIQLGSYILLLAVKAFSI